MDIPVLLDKWNRFGFNWSDGSTKNAQGVSRMHKLAQKAQESANKSQAAQWKLPSWHRNPASIPRKQRWCASHLGTHLQSKANLEPGVWWSMARASSLFEAKLCEAMFFLFYNINDTELLWVGYAELKRQNQLRSSSRRFCSSSKAFCASCVQVALQALVSWFSHEKILTMSRQYHFTTFHLISAMYMKRKRKERSSMNIKQVSAELLPLLHAVRHLANGLASVQVVRECLAKLAWWQQPIHIASLQTSHEWVLTKKLAREQWPSILNVARPCQTRVWMFRPQHLSPGP